MNPLNQIVTQLYDPVGHPTVSITPIGLRTTLAYDLGGCSPVSSTDGMGNTTTFIHDLNHQLAAVVDPLGRRTSFTYDGAGNRTSVRDPLGRITTYVYNARSLVKALVDPAGNRTTYLFDESANRTATLNVVCAAQG